MRRAASELKLRWRAKKKALKEHKDVSFVVKEGERADSAIIDFVDECGATHLYVGRRGLGRVARLLLGSTSRSLVENAQATVVVCNVKQRSWDQLTSDYKLNDLLE
jgi:nucleotide-binding universal stress UspA family protein